MFNFEEISIKMQKAIPAAIVFVGYFLTVPALPSVVLGEEPSHQELFSEPVFDHPPSPFSSEIQSPPNLRESIEVSEDSGQGTGLNQNGDSTHKIAETNSAISPSNHFEEETTSPSSTANYAELESSEPNNYSQLNNQGQHESSPQKTNDGTASSTIPPIDFTNDWRQNPSVTSESTPYTPFLRNTRVVGSFPHNSGSGIERYTQTGISPSGKSRTLQVGRYSNLFRPDWELPSSFQRSPYGEVPVVLNTSVARNLHYFSTNISERFQEYLNRFAQYKGLVQQIFLEFGLPPELSYLSLVESGFNPRAYSRARAAGPWQFMKATGRLYGLGVTWYVDERRDPIKSTVAAAHHLRDLYDRFGSWPLALAAYNAGTGKVSRAMRKTGTRDFWKIRRTRYIRRETKEYVPRFMAATLIAENPQDYGFSVNPVNPHRYDEVVIKDRVHLNSVSKITGISFDELRRLNPELRRSIIPHIPEGYYLKIPAGMKSTVEEQKQQFQLWTQPPPPPTKWYRVRRGDSLSVVAKRFGMSVRTLKNLNHLSGNLIRAGKRLRVRADDPPINMNSSWYTVRYGDSLSTIAHRYRMSVRAIKRLNNRSSNLIHVGDKLRVRGKLPSTSETKWYRVRQGDSLWTIARRFSVSVTDLKMLNNLTSSVIRAGRLLLVSQ